MQIVVQTKTAMQRITVMNSLITCVLLAVLSVASAHPEWESFKKTNGKRYGSSLEDSLRKTIFLQNKDKVERFNSIEADKVGYNMGLNHLSDRTHHEIYRLSGFRMPKEGFRNTIKAQIFFDNLMASADDNVPESLDWREFDGRVTPVKDQGECGGCWAFSATGALEGQMKSRTGKLDILSEQNLIDCSEQNEGCSGGWMNTGWEDIHKEGGIENDSEYPFLGYRSHCKFNKTKAVFSDVSSYTLKQGDEEILKRTVATFGPVSVAIDASLHSFDLYQDGVYYDSQCDSFDLSHGTLVVGYGTEAKGGDYWIVKNSWSEDWGIKGYIKMARNRNNHCGIATAAMIPTF